MVYILKQKANTLPVGANMILPQFSLCITRHSVPHCVCCRISSMWTCLCSFISSCWSPLGGFQVWASVSTFAHASLSSLQDDNRLRFLIFSDVERIILNPLYVFRPHRVSKPLFQSSDLSFHWQLILNPWSLCLHNTKMMCCVVNLAIANSGRIIHDCFCLNSIQFSECKKRAYRGPINPHRWKLDCFL